TLPARVRDADRGRDERTGRSRCGGPGAHRAPHGRHGGRDPQSARGLAVDAQPGAHATGGGLTDRRGGPPNWGGDAVLSLPFLRALRAAHPSDRLAVLAPRGPASIYRASGIPVDVLERSRSLAGDARTVRAGRFDEAWLLPNSLRAALVAYLGGA